MGAHGNQWIIFWILSTNIDWVLLIGTLVVLGVKQREFNVFLNETNNNIINKQLPKAIIKMSQNDNSSWRQWLLKNGSWVYLQLNTPDNAGDIRDVGSITGIRKILWKRKWQSTPVFLHGESHGQRSLAALQWVGHDWSDLAGTHISKSTQWMTQTVWNLFFPIR